MGCSSLPKHVLIIIIIVIIVQMERVRMTGTCGGGTSCRDRCGSTRVKYPLGTGPGCGSPVFSPYIRCRLNGSGGEQLFLESHSGSYPISSISYESMTLTLTPPSMSTCSSMHPSPATTFGLDWASPFQIASSTFLLLSCRPSPSHSLCDPSFDYLCAAIYSCPALLSSLNMPLFPPTNSCCVYSPANLPPTGQLDLSAFSCSAYSSVTSLGDNPTDPTHWLYGVALKYSVSGALDNSYVTTKCSTCEKSGGICGFAPPANGFLCVCKEGYNTSLDCSSISQINQNYVSNHHPSHFPTPAWYVWSSILAGITFSLV